jgi:hypothetical protein
VNLDEVWYVIDGIEYYLDYILFYLGASTIPKWWTFKLLRWAQFLIRLVTVEKILNWSEGIDKYLY